jgi:hypothetical protein
MAKLIIILIMVMYMFPGSGAHAANNRRFQSFVDFRYCGEASKQVKAQIYLDYMGKFAELGTTALYLTNPVDLPPFTYERNFLSDAQERGIKVWLRTNRVSPKSGIPGLPHSTLDFALDKDIQKLTLDYLLDMAALSKDYPNMTGLIIGGEEWVGAYVDSTALARHRDAGLKELGFDITGSLSNYQKICYFDWLQKIQNDWYGQIWDTLHAAYPQLELFIYPSSIAVCGDRFSSFPRPAYWDIHDLIVTRNKPFSIILPTFTIEDALGSYQTGAFAAYLRAATEGRVPYYLLLQVGRDGPAMRAPTPEELDSHLQAALDSGARGVGYWPVDMDVQMDVYNSDPPRWQAMFQSIAKGALYLPPPARQSGVYVVKPRYSQFWQMDAFQTIRTVAGLRRAGVAPQFLLAEQILAQPLPPEARIYYLPETYKYESPGVIEKLSFSGKMLFFSLGSAEPCTPDKQTLPSLFTMLDLNLSSPIRKVNPATSHNLNASWKETSYKLIMDSPFTWPVWKNGDLAVATFTDLADPSIISPLIFTDKKVTFLSASDYGLLLGADKDNQNAQLIRRLIPQVSHQITEVINLLLF